MRHWAAYPALDHLEFILAHCPYDTYVLASGEVFCQVAPFHSCMQRIHNPSIVHAFDALRHRSAQKEFERKCMLATVKLVHS